MSVKSAYPKNPTQPKKHSKAGNKPPKKSKGNLLLLLGLTGLAMLSATAGALLAVSMSATPLRQSKLSPQELSVFSSQKAISYKNLNLPQLSRPVNILVLGIKVLTTDVDGPQDKSQGYQALVNSFQGLADTMLLVRFDPAKQKLSVLSIPRDTRVEIADKGFRKINEANVAGGPALAAETVSHLLGDVPIDRYVRVNVQGVEKFIDALGGVTVYVPKDMKYNDFSQHLYIDLKKGEQHLDGAKAVGFLRYRYDQFGDIGRVQRQQMFMRSLVEQSLKPQTLLKIPDILSVIQSHIDTNLTVEELVALAGFASQTQRSNVQMMMLPGGFSGNGRHEVSYWLPDEEKIKTLVAQHFEEGYGQPSDTDPTDLRIAVQDSTGDPEAARQMIRYLRQAGFRRAFISEDWSVPLKTTRIVAQNGDDGGAATLRASIGVGEILVESTGNLASDVSIQLGEDWKEKYPQLQQAR